MYLYQPIINGLFKFNNDDVDYYFGIGHKGIKSDLYGILTTWIFYYLMMHFLFYVIGGIMKYYVGLIWPEAGTNKISKELVSLHIKSSEIAFPLYTFVPVLGDFLRKKGWSSTCESLEECGGITQSFFNFFLFLFVLEFIVFFDHYYILHVWKWGKKHLKHDIHHQYEASDEMTTYTGFAFDPLDGFSQGIGLAICQLIFPIPCYFVWVLSLMIGCWTMYIHQGVPHLPMPFMGADYHFIHHKYNWYAVCVHVSQYNVLPVVTCINMIYI